MNQSNIDKLGKIAIGTATLATAATIYQAYLGAPKPLKADKKDVLNYQYEDDYFCEKYDKDDPKEACLKYAKRNIAKYIYITDVEVPAAGGEDIDKRTKNTQFFKLGEHRSPENKNIVLEEWHAKAFVGSPFYKKGDKWLETGIATATPEDFQAAMMPTIKDRFLALLGREAWAVDTDYTSAGDGRVGYDNRTGSETWTAIRAKTTGTYAQATETTNGQCTVNRLDTDGSGFWIERGFFPVNTASLPDSAVISSSTFAVYKTRTVNDDNDSALHLISSTQPDPNTLTTAEYDNVVFTDSFGSYTCPDGTDNADNYIYIQLNATGLAYFQVATTTFFATVGDNDFNGDGDPPAANKYTPEVDNAFSETTGTGSDPYFLIDYTIPTYSNQGQIIILMDE